MTSRDNEEAEGGRKQGREACGCCSLLVSETPQKFELQSPPATFEVRNFQFLDFFIYFEPGSDVWKCFRIVKLSVLVCLMVPIPPVVGILGFFARDSDSRNSLSIVAGVLGIWLGISSVLFSNVDLVMLRLKSVLAVVDVASLLVVSGMLIAFGNEFFLFGVGAFFALATGAYSIEGVELDFDLNTGGKPDVENLSSPGRGSVRLGLGFELVRREQGEETGDEDGEGQEGPQVNDVMKLKRTQFVKYLCYLSLLSGTVIVRALIFIKFLTVPQDPVLVLDANTVTIRDIWEFWVDILVLRLVYVCFHRLTWPAGKYILPREAAVITTTRIRKYR